ncbi:MAG: P1 family peptidase [Rhizobiales bacterium]|nr:P1 family peptidase [Hyphomicrobiales bacterium]
MNVHPGPRNLITDVEGVMVGNAHDEGLRSGVTVLLPGDKAVAGLEIRGGAPGTRETDAADPSCLVDHVHGIVLAGGSVFGLAAADAVTNWLAARGTGFSFRQQPHVCPIVQAANLFDLTNGGDKTWGEQPPYHALGTQACAAAGETFALGNAGAGQGALAGIYKGGLGSASAKWGNYTAGAIVAVNSFGSPVIPGTGRLWAGELELNGEFGGRPAGEILPAGTNPEAETKAQRLRSAATAGQNTTIGAVATNAPLSPAQAQRLAIMAADGLPRAVRPIHTPFDGDVVFAVATGTDEGEVSPLDLAFLGTVAADCMARAIGRAIWEAETVGDWLSYREAHGR